MICIVITVGCSRVIDCVSVGGTNVCFIRQVRGLNGDDVHVTTSDNVCHEPSPNDDYISDTMGAGEDIYYKVTGNELLVYGSAGVMIPPQKQFPGKIVFDDNDPVTPGRDLKKEGFTPLQLDYEKMTWCPSDVF